MRYVWEPEDIRYGIFYHRGFSIPKSPGENSHPGDYAWSCLHKISCIHHFCKDQKKTILGRDENQNKLYFATAMSDGCTYMLGTAEEAAKSLNHGGYKRTTKQELLRMIEAGCPSMTRLY